MSLAPIERSNVYDPEQDFEALLASLFDKGMLTLDAEGQIILTPEGWREVDGMGPG